MPMIEQSLPAKKGHAMTFRLLRDTALGLDGPPPGQGAADAWRFKSAPSPRQCDPSDQPQHS